MTKLPEGRKPLPKEWFVDRVKAITPMTDEERQRAKEKEEANTEKRCVSCGGPAYRNDWCSFCLEEE